MKYETLYVMKTVLLSLCGRRGVKDQNNLSFHFRVEHLTEEEILYEVPSFTHVSDI